MKNSTYSETLARKDDSNHCHISVVIPVYNAVSMLDELVSRLGAVIRELTSAYEVILVDDRSPDDAWHEIARLAGINEHVKGISLSRNFGQHAAITAGLELATGEWIVVMDCDLQDIPEEIPNLYARTQAGYDIVFAQRVDRQDHFWKRLSSKAFYGVFGYLTDTKLDHSIANFGIYSQRVIGSILAMQDHIRYFPTMCQWVGFKVSHVPVKHASRAEGQSAYGFVRLMRLASDNIVAFSNKPLRLATFAGMFISMLSAVIAAYYLIMYWMGGVVVSGYTSLILSVWFLSGCIILMLGIVGLYVGKMFDQTKSRPLYIIDKKVNVDACQTPRLGF